MSLTIARFALGLLLLLAAATFAQAQSGSLYYGGGTATDSSIGSINTLDGGVVYSAPSLGGFFETVGGDVIFFHNLGIGAEVSFRNGKAPYAGLEYSPKFYDVNVVYQRRAFTDRFLVEVQGGLGRANLNFYYTPQFCLGFPQGCRSNTAQATGANYLELHGAGGLRYYVYKGVFVRPQVDLRWVHDFTYFGRSVVPEFTFAVGYTLRRGRR